MFVTKYTNTVYEIHGYDDKSDRFAVYLPETNQHTWISWKELSRKLAPLDFDAFKNEQYKLRFMY